MKYLIKVVFNKTFYERGFKEEFDEIPLFLKFFEMEDMSWSVYIDSSSICNQGDYCNALLRFLFDEKVPISLLSDKSRFDLYYLKTPVGQGEILGL